MRARTEVSAVGVRSLLLDLDGCVWFGERLAPGAAELIEDLRDGGLGVGFLTNISSGDAAVIADKLTRLGIPATRADVMMPIDALASHPRMRSRPIAYVLGRDEVADAVRSLTDVSSDPDKADIVVLARDPDLTYAQLAEALHVLHRGGALLALNLDARVPVDGGRILPGNGAIAAALTAASGVDADLIGKPSARFFHAALERFGFDGATTLMVGDTLDSDIAGGVSAGLRTVLVGGSHFSGRQPMPVADFEVASLADLRALLALPQKVAEPPAH